MHGAGACETGGMVSPGAGPPRDGGGAREAHCVRWGAPIRAPGHPLLPIHEKTRKAERLPGFSRAPWRACEALARQGRHFP